MDAQVKILWDFLQVEKKLEKADVMFVLGSFDLRIPLWASALENYAPLIIMSGGRGRLTPKDWKGTEAEKFVEVALIEGVSKDKVLLEEKSTNTRDNLFYCWEILKNKKINPKKIIILSQPFMQKRVQALIIKMQELGELGDFQPILPSSTFTHENYPSDKVSKEEMVNLLVGEIERLKEYPKKGFIAQVSIPKKVLKAEAELIKQGFNKYLV